METPLIPTQITSAALTAARLISAKTGEKQCDVVQRVLQAEARRLGLISMLEQEGERGA